MLIPPPPFDHVSPLLFCCPDRAKPVCASIILPSSPSPFWLSVSTRASPTEEDSSPSDIETCCCPPMGRRTDVCTRRLPAVTSSLPTCHLCGQKASGVVGEVEPAGHTHIFQHARRRVLNLSRESHADDGPLHMCGLGSAAANPWHNHHSPAERASSSNGTSSAKDHTRRKRPLRSQDFLIWEIFSPVTPGTRAV